MGLQEGPINLLDQFPEHQHGPSLFPLRSQAPRWGGGGGSSGLDANYPPLTVGRRSLGGGGGRGFWEG